MVKSPAKNPVQGQKIDNVLDLDGKQQNPDVPVPLQFDQGPTQNPKRRPVDVPTTQTQKQPFRPSQPDQKNQTIKPNANPKQKAYVPRAPSPPKPQISDSGSDHEDISHSSLTSDHNCEQCLTDPEEGDSDSNCSCCSECNAKAQMHDIDSDSDLSHAQVSSSQDEQPRPAPPRPHRPRKPEEPAPKNQPQWKSKLKPRKKLIDNDHLDCAKCEEKDQNFRNKQNRPIVAGGFDFKSVTDPLMKSVPDLNSKEDQKDTKDQLNKFMNGARPNHKEPKTPDHNNKKQKDPNNKQKNVSFNQGDPDDIENMRRERSQDRSRLSSASSPEQMNRSDPDYQNYQAKRREQRQRNNDSRYSSESSYADDTYSSRKRSKDSFKSLSPKSKRNLRHSTGLQPSTDKRLEKEREKIQKEFVRNYNSQKKLQKELEILQNNENVDSKIIPVDELVRQNLLKHKKNKLEELQLTEIERKEKENRLNDLRREARKIRLLNQENALKAREQMKEKQDREQDSNFNGKKEPKMLLSGNKSQEREIHYKHRYPWGRNQKKIKDDEIRAQELREEERHTPKKCPSKDQKRITYEPIMDKQDLQQIVDEKIKMQHQQQKLLRHEQYKKNEEDELRKKQEQQQFKEKIKQRQKKGEQSQQKLYNPDDLQFNQKLNQQNEHQRQQLIPIVQERCEEELKQEREQKLKEQKDQLELKKQLKVLQSNAKIQLMKAKQQPVPIPEGEQLGRRTHLDDLVENGPGTNASPATRPSPSRSPGLRGGGEEETMSRNQSLDIKEQRATSKENSTKFDNFMDQQSKGRTETSQERKINPMIVSKEKSKNTKENKEKNSFCESENEFGKETKKPQLNGKSMSQSVFLSEKQLGKGQDKRRRAAHSTIGEDNAENKQETLRGGGPQRGNLEINPNDKQKDKVLSRSEYENFLNENKRKQDQVRQITDTLDNKNIRLKKSEPLNQEEENIYSQVQKMTMKERKDIYYRSANENYDDDENDGIKIPENFIMEMFKEAQLPDIPQTSGGAGQNNRRSMPDGSEMKQDYAQKVEEEIQKQLWKPQYPPQIPAPPTRQPVVKPPVPAFNIVDPDDEEESQNAKNYHYQPKKAGKSNKNKRTTPEYSKKIINTKFTQNKDSSTHVEIKDTWREFNDRDLFKPKKIGNNGDSSSSEDESNGIDGNFRLKAGLHLGGWKQQQEIRRVIEQVEVDYPDQFMQQKQKLEDVIYAHHLAEQKKILHVPSEYERQLERFNRFNGRFHGQTEVDEDAIFKDLTNKNSQMDILPPGENQDRLSNLIKNQQKGLSSNQFDLKADFQVGQNAYKNKIDKGNVEILRKDTLTQQQVHLLQPTNWIDYDPAADEDFEFCARYFEFPDDELNI